MALLVPAGAMAVWTMTMLGALGPRVRRLGITVFLAASVLGGAAQVAAASPEPTSAIAGDPRSSGQGPGFVGDPPTAIVVTLAVGLGAAIATYVYVRVTAKRDDDDIQAPRR